MWGRVGRQVLPVPKGERERTIHTVVQRERWGTSGEGQPDCCPGSGSTTPMLCSERESCRGCFWGKGDRFTGRFSEKPVRYVGLGLRREGGLGLGEGRETRVILYCGHIKNMNKKTLRPLHPDLTH